MIDWRWILKNRVLPSRMPEPELQVKHALLQVHGTLFVDIGANFGMYSLLLRKNFEKIVAIEPSPYSLPTLTRRTRRCGNITIMNLALSDRDETATLFVSSPRQEPKRRFLLRWYYHVKWYSPHGGDTLLEVHPQGAQNASTVDVKTLRYDSLFSNLKVDLVKMDVEGGEFKVLAGMHESLSRGKVHNIVVEIHDDSRRSSLESILNGYNFVPEWVDSNHILGRLQFD